MGKAPNVIWTPLPGSQALALSCPAEHILYEGSRGPGKTDAQLMFFRKHVGRGWGSHWRGVIFDREYKMLDDLVAKAWRWFPKFNDGAKFHRSTGAYKWTWPTGEELYFRQIKRDEDYWQYHGQEFAFIGWNELCKFPTPKLYDDMMSCNRTSFSPLLHSPDPANPLPKVPLTVFATANPYGPGHAWVKKRFIDVAPAGVVVRKTVVVFNPQTQREEPVTKRQVRLFGSFRENTFLTPEYISELYSIKDPNKRKAWLGGDWNIVAGGALDDVWHEPVHIMPRFVVPKSWYLDRSFDWGSSKPFSVGWWAQADGTEAVLADGRRFCPIKGSLIRFDEWYGESPSETETNVGLKLSAKRIAETIDRHEKALIGAGWIHSRPYPGPADSSIFDATRKDVESIATEMLRGGGIEWERSDKSPGSRKRGLQLVRERLENGLIREGPALYLMENCLASKAQLPALPRDPKDPDDVDTDAPDHAYDEIRYRCLKGAGSAATHIETTHAT